MNHLDDRSRELRQLVVLGLTGGQRGHIGSSLSLIEILRVLFDHHLQYRPQEPNWKDRDRFLLSKGHGCLALYALLVDKGFIPSEELDRFCEPDGILGGHPRRPPKYLGWKPPQVPSDTVCRSLSGHGGGQDSGGGISGFGRDGGW